MTRFLLLVALVLTLVATFALGGEYDGVDSYPTAESRGDSGWSSGGLGWGPRFRFLNFRIPIPIIPKIRIGLKAGWQQQGWGGWW